MVQKITELYIYIDKGMNIYYSKDKEADAGDNFSGEKYK